MTLYARFFGTRKTSQGVPIPGKAQEPNSAGGFAFAVDDWTRLDRFLILGSEGGSYYATEQKLSVENAQAVAPAINADGPRTVLRIVEVSDSGRAPKNDPAIFALAMCAALGNTETKQAALAALPKVCRIGTHLFQFAESVQAFRGWGRGLRRAVANWYLQSEGLPYQLIKYQSRNGWCHRDLLRLSHPKTEGERNAALRWAVGRPTESLPPIIAAFEAAKTASVTELVNLIREQNLPREAIGTGHLNNADVWAALLERMPVTAMIRNLGKMTAVGLLSPQSEPSKKICAELTDTDRLRKARIHPVALLVALKTYAQGRGDRGKLSWSPVSQIVDALDRAFYLAFETIEPTNQRWLLGLDVSGSMGGSRIAGMPNLSAREGSAAMALVTAATEPTYAVIGFTGRGFSVSDRTPWPGYRSGVEPLSISPRQRLDDVVRSISNLPMGPTDCALPMIYAQAQKMPVDVFVIYTDSETWHGDIHPCQALQQYRQKMGIPAKLIVVGMVANRFSIADPDDGGMMDVVGFDTTAPGVIADFARA